MKVHYNSSLWGRGKGLPGFPQKVNWQFEYVGTKRCIPAIYRFPNGIVFDIITFLDEAKLHEFFQKHEDSEESLTPLQRRLAEQEHLYRDVEIKEIWINGKQVERGYSSSGSISIPWSEQSDELAPIQKAYSSILVDNTCFACQRFCIPYPKADSRLQKIKRFLRIDIVNTIKLSTHIIEKFFPLDISFQMSSAETQKEVCFKQTGKKSHTPKLPCSLW